MAARMLMMGAAAIVLGGLATAVGASNAVRRTGHAALREGEHAAGTPATDSELRVEAPYGAWVVQYNVSPGPSGLSSGQSVGVAPLFGMVTTSSSWLPSKGFDADVPLDVEVRISTAFSPAAAVRAPTTKEAALVGTWLLITKDRRRVDDLERQMREGWRTAGAL